MGFNRTDIQGIEIASRVRHASPTAVVCIHGLGDAGSSFDPLFREKSLNDLTLTAVDMPGCGRSAKPTNFTYSMKDQAGILLDWVKEFSADRIILAGHSMGGVIGLYTAENTPFERISGFVNIEGNFGPEDCFFSGRIASYPEDDFEEAGFKAVIRALRKETASDPLAVMVTYARNFSRALPLAVHRSSVSLVEESGHSSLKERFRDLPIPKAYISGSRSLIPTTAEYLAESSIPHFTVPDSGHFMMVERPDAFCEAFRQALMEMGII